MSPKDEHQNDVRLMSYEELFSLFKHLDESAHKKESLFLGIALAIVPAVYVSWDRLSVFSIGLAAVMSIALYWLHMLHIARYGESQKNLVIAMKLCRSDFGKVFDVPPSMSIRKIRSKFRWILITFWSLIFITKIVKG